MIMALPTDACQEGYFVSYQAILCRTMSFCVEVSLFYVKLDFLCRTRVIFGDIISSYEIHGFHSPMFVRVDRLTLDQ